MRVHAKRMPVLVVGAVFAASLVLIAVSRTSAQDQAGGSGLSLSPTRTELKIEKGATDKVEINIRNVTRGPIVAKPFISDFESDDATGEPKLFADSTKHNSASINSFISGLQDVSLAAGESKDLTYTINIPADASAGGYYGAVTYRAVPANQANPENGEVALTANVASLVLIEIPGDITEQVQVSSVKVLKDKKAGSFFTKSPSQVAIAVKNNGNSFSKPFGTVSVSDMSGKQVYSYELNNSTPRGNILPKSSRTFTDELKNISKPGRYTVTANVSHGTGGEVITQKVSFWYLPVWLLIAMVVVIAGIAGGAYYLYRKQFGSRKRK